MYNLVFLRGRNVACLAAEIPRFGSLTIRNIVLRQQKFGSCFLLHTSQKHNTSSKPIFTHNVCAEQSEDYTDVVKEVELPSNSGNSVKHRKRVQVLLLEKSLALKSLVSNEGPAVHHAQAGAVVDVRADVDVNDVSNLKRKGEVRLHVEQLLKDAKASVQRVSTLQTSEDTEYKDESAECKKEKTQLIGALRPNALDWRSQELDIAKLGSYYASLSKSRLTGLVVLTAMAGYAMAPSPLVPLEFIYCSLGTCLISSAANTINQFFEVPYDSQMDRTRNRILVRGLVSPLHGICFASVCGIMGIGMLFYGVNGFAASLGALNLLLYTSVYTPLKRMSIINTWVGSVVGAIPPLIGWAGCSGNLETGAWIMAAVLYAWQFPHFNALSWNLRPDYSRAGYRMMSVTNPGMCKRVALRHSVGMIIICTLAPVLDVTTWTFAVDSLPFNGYLVYLAWRFYKDGDSKSSRKLFMFSLIHLPAVMMMMIISKKHYNKQEETDTVEKETVSNELFLKSENQIYSSTVK